MPIWYAFFALISLDFLTVFELRSFLLQFTGKSKNRKKYRQIYETKTPIEKITLSFIEQMLKRDKGSFLFFQKMYVVVLVTLVPQYILFSLCTVFMPQYSIHALIFFGTIKIIICLIMRFHVDSNGVSVYRKK